MVDLNKAEDFSHLAISLYGGGGSGLKVCCSFPAQFRLSSFLILFSLIGFAVQFLKPTEVSAKAQQGKRSVAPTTNSSFSSLLPPDGKWLTDEQGRFYFLKRIPKKHAIVLMTRPSALGALSRSPSVKRTKNTIISRFINRLKQRRQPREETLRLWSRNGALFLTGS
jgi:hypothetical protein